MTDQDEEIKVFTVERRRLVVVFETSRVVAKDQNDAMKQAAELIDAEWVQRSVSKCEADDMVQRRLAVQKASIETAQRRLTINDWGTAIMMGCLCAELPKVARILAGLLP